MSTTRHGLTMIEVVIATATLAIAATMIAGGIGFTQHLNERNRQRLAAIEVAHRIIITHVRDRKELRGQPHRVLFDGNYYTFDLDEDLLPRETVGGTGPVRRASKKSSDSTLQEKLENQLFRITVNVWLDGPEGEGRPPLATMSRVFNPFFGDADSIIDLLVNDPEIGPQLDR